MLPTESVPVLVSDMENEAVLPDASMAVELPGKPEVPEPDTKLEE